MQDNIIAEIEEYFKGFFDDLICFKNPLVISFVGYRNGYKFGYTLKSPYGGDMLHHELENIEGEIVRKEQTILLENNG